jgi:glycosyltransferase involved in cell wall biosynthesis
MTIPVTGFVPTVNGAPVLSQAFVARATRKISRFLRGTWDAEITRAYANVFHGARVVLAEYGPCGVKVLPACERARVPLVVHFHGYDASVTSVLDSYRERYRELFLSAAGIISVSTSMHNALLGLGAPPEKTHYIPYGIDCDAFRPSSAAPQRGLILAAGNLVEKKAPHLTILAFSEVRRVLPTAKLRFIGDGPLRGVCHDLIASLRLGDSVEMLGAMSHIDVLKHIQTAQVFVQHSVRAMSGDSEGTPNVILEAGACGVPVVSTRHAGILDAVLEGETGFLVDERDVAGMARAVIRLVNDAEFSVQVGRAARKRIESAYSLPQQIDKLWTVLASAQYVAHKRPQQQ